MFANFRLKKLLGEGLTGNVFLAKDRSCGDTVALKLMRSKHEIIQEQGEIGVPIIQRMLENEAKTLIYIEKKANISGVVQVKSAGQCRGMPYIAMEYCPEGDLFDALEEKQRFSEREALRIFKRLVETVRDLHGIGVIHRDLKLQNVVLGKDGFDPKICDFGVAKIIGKHDIFESVSIGTAGYSAPETYSQKEIL